MTGTVTQAETAMEEEEEEETVTVHVIAESEIPTHGMEEEITGMRE